MKLFLIMALATAGSTAFAAETTTEKQFRESENAAILMQHYPARALAAHEQGAVGFRLSLDRDGDPTGCAVTQSSGYPSLDHETCDLLLRYARYQPNRNNNGARVSMDHEGVINWTLPGQSTLLVSAPVKVAAADPMDKQICKKTLRIGTLSSFERTCRTRREWAGESDAMKKNWEDIQGTLGSSHGKD